MTTDALKSARQQVEQLEGEMLEDIRTKAELLGFQLVKATEQSPKQKRKRRTKEEIAAAHAE